MLRRGVVRVGGACMVLRVVVQGAVQGTLHLQHNIRWRRVLLLDQVLESRLDVPVASAFRRLPACVPVAGVVVR